MPADHTSAIDSITHPEKVLFPDDGITKGELAAYYEAMAPVILPHLRGRPVTMERYPSGIGKKGFWQKDVSKGFPEWLERVEVPKKDGVVHHPVVTDTRSLLWMTNQNTITQHVWTSRVPDLYYPDICVFDLDPSKDDPAGRARRGDRPARPARELGLPSWVKTSGSKGFHIVVPLDGKASMDEVARFANASGALFVTLAPDRLTQEFSKADRTRADLRRHRQQRLQRDVRGGRTPCAPSAARRCRRRARGTRSSAARWTRARSRCGTCRRDRQGRRPLGRHAARKDARSRLQPRRSTS